MKNYTVKDSTGKVLVSIEAPEGKMIDEKVLKTGKIEFIDEPVKLPQSWEELGKVGGECINNNSEILELIPISTPPENKNIIPTGLGEPLLALIQLLQLRDRYNEGWTPDWTDTRCKYCIHVFENKLSRLMFTRTNNILAFKTEELRDTFFNAPKIRELLEIAKPLL